MKNLYFSLALCLLTITAGYAQPTITAATAGTIGDVFSFDMVNAEGFDPGTGGENVTWDFSGITLDGTSSGYTFVTPGSTGHGDLFPGANVAADQGADNYVYYKINASEWSLHGVYTPVTTLSYSDPETYLTFPLTYGSTFSDNLYCEYFTGIETIRDGSVSVEADGYGTLKLPGGNYENVLRVVLHELYSDEFTGLPFTSDYDFTHYYFLREGTKGPLFQYSYMVVGGLTPTTVESASVNANIGAVSISDHQTDNTLSLFPNPAQNTITVNLQNIAAEQVLITDISGRTLLTKTISGNTSSVAFDVHDLPAGMYLARVITTSQIYTEQFQIIH